MNSRKLTAISTLLSGVAAVALLVGTFATGGRKAYASQVAAIGGAAVSGIQVQNLESSTAATIQLALYPQGGGAPTVLTRSNVGGESSANFYLPSEAVGTGAYGAVLSSDKQIAAIARTEWTSGGRGGAATYNNVPPSPTVILPLLLGPTTAAPGGYASQISEFSIQNAGSDTATATVNIYPTGSGSPLATASYSIGAGTSRTLRMGVDFTGLPDTQALPAGFVGYARITSATPLVVQSYVDFTNSTRAVYAFSGVPAAAAATTLYAPLLRRDYYGTTGVSLVNPIGTAATVTLTYYNDPLSPSQLSGGSASETVTVPANSSILVYQGFRPGNPLPDPDAGAGQISNNNGWFGSAKMESTQPILAVVNDAVIDNTYTTLTSAAYNAATSTDGATKIFAPLVRRRHTGYLLTTGIQVQNIGGAPTNITVTFKNSAGATVGSQSASNVGAGASVNFYQDADPFPAGDYGSAVITSSGQPIALIVNDFSIPGAPTVLDAALYNGLR